MCLGELGWQDCPNGSPNGCDIVWHSCASQSLNDHTNNENLINSSNKEIKINKLPSKLDFNFI